MLKSSNPNSPNIPLDEGVEEESKHFSRQDISLNWKYNILSSDEVLEEAFEIEKENNDIPLDHDGNTDISHGMLDSLEEINRLELSDDEIEEVLADGTLFNLDTNEEHGNLTSETTNEPINIHNLTNFDNKTDFQPETNFIDNPLESKEPDHPILEKTDHMLDSEILYDSYDNLNIVTDEKFFEDNIEESPITLSDEELETALDDSSRLSSEFDQKISMGEFKNDTSLEEESDFIYKPDETYISEVKQINQVESEIGLSYPTEIIDTTSGEKFFEESIEEGPIALSDQELENALMDSSSLPIESDQKISVDEFNEDSNLNEDFDFTFKPDEINQNEEIPDKITTEPEFSYEDLITADTGEILEQKTEKQDMTSAERFFEENIDEGPIALSNEELENALIDTSNLPSELDQEISLDEYKDNESVEEDFDFPFKPDEYTKDEQFTNEFPRESHLEHEDLKTAETGEVSDKIQENLVTTFDEKFFEENIEGGPITLSDEELENALMDSSNVQSEIDQEISLDDVKDNENVEENLDFPLKSDENIEDEQFNEEFSGESRLEYENLKPAGVEKISDELQEKQGVPSDEKIFEENIDEGPITLSDEELEYALMDSSNLPSESDQYISLNEFNDEDNLDDEFDFTFNPNESVSMQDSSNEIIEKQRIGKEDLFPHEEVPIENEENQLDSEISLSDTSTNLNTTSDKSFFEENIEEGSISLSDEELENALRDSSNLPYETDQEISLDEYKGDEFDLTFNPEESFSKEESHKEITDEVSEVRDKNLLDSGISLSDSEQMETKSDEKFFEENIEEGPIALSDEELENAIVESTPDDSFSGEIQEEKKEYINDQEDNFEIPVINDENLEEEKSENLEMKPEMGTHMEESSIQKQPDEDDEWEIQLTPEDYKKIPSEVNKLPEQKVHKEMNTSEIISDEEGKVNFHEEPNISLPNRDELKKVVAYLDNLLGELPDELIEKFAKSEYFKLYQKVMEDLGL